MPVLREALEARSHQDATTCRAKIEAGGYFLVRKGKYLGLDHGQKPKRHNREDWSRRNLNLKKQKTTRLHGNNSMKNLLKAVHRKRKTKRTVWRKCGEI